MIHDPSEKKNSHIIESFIRHYIPLIKYVSTLLCDPETNIKQHKNGNNLTYFHK